MREATVRVGNGFFSELGAVTAAIAFLWYIAYLPKDAEPRLEEPHSASWMRACSEDVNGDGYQDLVFRDAGGDIYHTFIRGEDGRLREEEGKSLADMLAVK